ncbi:hypothetical protein M5D96_011410 [Drosophila gunungcola]|uniref:Uncharacterized protein n=1 Tax=Drosophila gunungcola TaxID=103775 RepID=A0A9Q0BL20_9MUSC|nr:hypothetical protein M5D96_011410 [Drosophila gunungcola]
MTQVCQLLMSAMNMEEGCSSAAEKNLFVTSHSNLYKFTSCFT